MNWGILESGDWELLRKSDTLHKKERNVQVSDTRDDDSSNAAGLIKILSL